MLKRDASGRIFVECPNCEKLHLVKRNRDYKAKKQVRFHCSACRTNWYATPEQQEEIAQAYSEPSKRQRAATQPKPQEKTQEKEASWLLKILP